MKPYGKGLLLEQKSPIKYKEEISQLLQSVQKSEVTLMYL